MDAEERRSNDEINQTSDRIIVLAEDIVGTLRICEWLGWVVLCLAVAGTVLNNAKLWPCFLFYLASNGISAYIHHRSGPRSLMVRDLIFFILAGMGLWQWTR
jgi:hypothetical protein